MALGLPWAAQAYNHQVQVGNGTSGQNIAPINLYYNYSYTQQIYTATQINGDCSLPGTIESISFYYAGSVTKTHPITVFMKTTDKTSFSSNTDWETVTADDIVYDANWTVSTAGWVTITLNEPFAYDGESNLLIAIDKEYGDSYSNQSFRYTAVTNNQVIHYRSDSTNPDPYSPTTATGTSANLPNIQFNMTIAHPAPSALTLDEVVINTATISWTAPTTTNTITGYAYEYTDGETIETGTTTGTTANLSGLTAATDYLFQVKAIYSDGESCWSEAFDFTTMEACMTPENLSITNVTAHTADLTWTEGYGDGQWVLKYKLSTEEEYTNSVNVALADLPYTLTGLTAESTYNVQIAPVCDATKTLAGNFTTTVACVAPTGLAFTLTPGDGTVASFSWTENGSATAWQLCINGDEDNLIDMDENPFTYNGFTPEQTYTAKVRAVCGGIDGESQWSSTVTFTPTNAYMLTVNDGTNTHSYVPFYGYYADSDANSQFIIPASALSSMQWGTINKITLYGSTASATWNGAVFDIYFSEVSNTEFESAALVDWSNLDSKVYTGSVSVVGNKMDLTLTTPYQYMGGNLLIGFDETTNSSNYPSMSWYGVTQTTNTAVYKYGSYSATLAMFLPKVTFAYEPGEEPTCFAPTGLAMVEGYPTAHGVSFTWDYEEGEVFQFALVQSIVTDPSIVDFNSTWYAGESFPTWDNLTADHDCSFFLRKKCSDTDFSNPVYVNFRTLEACPAPTEFAAMPNSITAHTADLTWEGTSESYQVAYRTVAYTDGTEEDFNNSSIPTGWVQKLGLLADVLAGTAQLANTTYGWSFGTANGVFNSHARTEIYGTSRKNWLITPKQTLVNNAQLSFDLALTYWTGTNVPEPNTTGTDDKFVVLISTDDMATWTILRQWDNDANTTGNIYAVYNDITCCATGEKVNIDLSAYAGENVYIAFYGESTTSNADNNLHIDNVGIGTPVAAGEWQYKTEVTEVPCQLTGLLAERKYEATLLGDCGNEGFSTEVGPITFKTGIACPAPTALNHANVKSTQADLSWTNGGAEDWVVAYKKTADENFTEVNVGTADVTIQGTTVTYTLTGLDAETAYTVQVRDNCEASVAGDGMSAWSATTSFTTMAACAVSNVAISNVGHYTATVNWDGESANGFTVKYRIPATLSLDGINEDFEDGVMPEGWTTEGLGTWTVGTGDYSSSTGAHGGTYNAKINHGTSGNVTYLVTPNLDLSEQSELNINLWYINRAWSGDIDGFGVYYRINGGEWNEIFATTEATTAWTEVNEALPANAYTTNCQIGFKFTDGYGYGVAIDDITLGNPSVIPAGEWQTVTTDENTANLSGLTAGTKYDLTVVPNCDEYLASEIQQFTTVSENVKYFITEGDWGTDANWEPAGAPTIEQTVELRANATITGEAFAKSIAGTGTGENNYTLTIENGGKLKHLNSGVRATVKKHINSYGTGLNADGNPSGYYLITNPITSYVTPSANNGFLVGNYDLYSWNYAQDLEWLNYKASAFNLSTGAYGYLYANETATDLTYTGTINAYTSNKYRCCSVASIPTTTTSRAGISLAILICMMLIWLAQARTAMPCLTSR